MNITTNWAVIDCIHCKALFAMPKSIERAYEDSHKPFYCPYCKKGMVYSGESDAEKFKRLYGEKRDCCENLQEVLVMRERQIVGHKGATGLIRKQRDQARAKLDADKNTEVNR